MIVNKGYDPAKIPGLVAWFDPDTLSGADGTAVASWAGRLNPNNVVSQATGAQQPTLATHSSGRRLVAFASASTQNLVGAVSGLPQRAPLTVVVVKQPATVTGFQTCVEYTSGAGSTGWQFGQNAATNAFTAYGKKEYDQTSCTAGGFEVDIASFQSDFSVFVEQNNGAFSTAVTGTLDIAGTCTTLEFGGHIGTSTPFNGKLGMVMIFNRVLSRAERCDLMRWMFDAYKLPAGDLGLYHGTMLSLPSADTNHSADHPDVVYIPGGFGPDGHPYWMAMTPYPGGSPGDATQENPTIISSADGLTWVNPTGLASVPIDPQPGLGFNSDTDLVYQGGALHMFYRQYAQGTGAGSEKIYYQTSTDGVTWTPSAPGQSVLTSVGITSANGLPSASINDARLVAPTVIYDTNAGSAYNGKWRMWTVRVTGNNTPQVAVVDHWTATSPTGTWTHDSVCPMAIPTSDTATGVNNGWDVWHIDIEWISALGLYVCLINDKAHLLWATSVDGITWKVASKSFLVPSKAQSVAGAPPWDGTQLYRSVFRLLPNNTAFEVWYAGIGGVSSASANNWHVGYVQVPVSELAA